MPNGKDFKLGERLGLLTQAVEDLRRELKAGLERLPCAEHEQRIGTIEKRMYTIVGAISGFTVIVHTLVRYLWR